MYKYAKYSVEMPDYALCYLVNGDDSGIDAADKKTIDAYMAQFEEEANSVNGDLVIAPSEDEGYFTHCPAFGLPCNVIDTDIVILTNKRVRKKARKP